MPGPLMITCGSDASPVDTVYLVAEARSTSVPIDVADLPPAMTAQPLGANFTVDHRYATWPGSIDTGAPWSAGHVYSIGDIVSFQGALGSLHYFKSVKNSNVGHQPDLM